MVSVRKSTLIPGPTKLGLRINGPKPIYYKPRYHTKLFTKIGAQATMVIMASTRFTINEKRTVAGEQWVKITIVNIGDNEGDIYYNLPHAPNNTVGWINVPDSQLIEASLLPKKQVVDRESKRSEPRQDPQQYIIPKRVSPNIESIIKHLPGFDDLSSSQNKKIIAIIEKTLKHSLTPEQIIEIFTSPITGTPSSIDKSTARYYIVPDLLNAAIDKGLSSKQIFDLLSMIIEKTWLQRYYTDHLLETFTLDFISPDNLIEKVEEALNNPFRFCRSLKASNNRKVITHACSLSLRYLTEVLKFEHKLSKMTAAEKRELETNLAKFNLTIEDYPLITVNLRPGADSEAGFLGKNEEFINILLRDEQVLKEHGIDYDKIADLLDKIYDVLPNKYAREYSLDVNGHKYSVHIEVRFGIQNCPWGERFLCFYRDDRPGIEILHEHHLVGSTADFTITNHDTGEKIWYSGLLGHLIKEHKFFEGFGTKYRRSPEDFIRFFNLKPGQEPEVRLLSYVQP